VCIQITTPMPMMLWVASIVEGVIENYVDMGILLGIQASPAVAKAFQSQAKNPAANSPARAGSQLINATISFYETTKAADAVAALKVPPHSIDPVNQQLPLHHSPRACTTHENRAPGPDPPAVPDPPHRLHWANPAVMTPPAVTARRR
jgi:hypothetical protein